MRVPRCWLLTLLGNDLPYNTALLVLYNWSCNSNIPISRDLDEELAETVSFDEYIFHEPYANIGSKYAELVMRKRPPSSYLTLLPRDVLHLVRRAIQQSFVHRFKMLSYHPSSTVLADVKGFTPCWYWTKRVRYRLLVVCL